jgi:uncharacterized protein (DUF433 family)
LKVPLKGFHAVGESIDQPDLPAEHAEDAEIVFGIQTFQMAHSGSGIAGPLVACSFPLAMPDFRCMDYRKIITIEPGKRGGQPCIRGMRLTVSDVLGYLASGMNEAEILQDFPELTSEDVRACFAFAADRERHTRLIKV